jgi:2-dehydropantoate 2-reductase
MKVGVVGCGALGGYYGAKLCRGGHEVHFLLRSDYDVVRRHGLSVRSPEGNFNARPKCAQTPAQIGECELIIIGLKTTANDRFSELLPPLVGSETSILTLQNGLGNETALARIFGSEKILGGLCFVCLNRLEPGVVQHLAHGKIVMGEYRRWPEPRTHDLATMIRHAGIPCKVTDNLERAHWEKLVWNIPFNGLGVASAAGIDACESGALTAGAVQQPCLTTDKLLGDPRWECLVRELMHEIIAAANAMELKLAESIAEKQIENTRSMGPYKASTLIDFERRQPLEMESLFLEPLRRARAAGVSTPRLDALCQVLQRLNPAG